MERLGFFNKWRQIVHQCISIVRFSVLVNGSLVGFFCSFPVMCHGDPLSPYLFILYTKVLSRLLLCNEEESCFYGVSVIHNCTSVSQLMFTNNLTLLGRASSREVEELKDCLDTYEQWSGQKMNKDKSSIFGSKNASKEITKNLGEIIGVATTPDTIDYWRHKLVL